MHHATVNLTPAFAGVYTAYLVEGYFAIDVSQLITHLIVFVNVVQHEYQIAPLF